MGNRLKDWNRLLDLVFHAVANILVAYTTTRDIWHSAAINSHYPFDKVFPLSASEVQLPVRKRIYTKSQLMEVDDLSGHLMLDLAPYPLLQLKL
jgi:hypothetical protein